MKCPSDSQPLAHLLVDQPFQSDIHLDICKACQGVWVDKDEVAQLISHFTTDHQKTYKNWLKATSEGKTDPESFWQESERICPKDSFLLQRHYIGAAHRVGVEQCPKCEGFWFDGSELYALAKANEPNLALDQAVAGAANSLRNEWEHDYDDKVVFWWDLYHKPGTAIPYIKDLLINLMIAFLVRK